MCLRIERNFFPNCLRKVDTNEVCLNSPRGDTEYHYGFYFCSTGIPSLGMRIYSADEGNADFAKRKWVHWTRGGAKVCDLTALSPVHSADLKSARKNTGAFASPSLFLNASIGRELQSHEINSVR
jgi:hypothetical protein